MNVPSLGVSPVGASPALSLSVPVLSVLLLITPGCGTVGAADSFAESEPFIEIVVDNRHINDVRIWAVSHAGNEYLGVVSGKDRATFTHPWSRADDLQLLARTLGGRSFTTRAIDTTPGEAVELLISASFAP